MARVLQWPACTSSAAQHAPHDKQRSSEQFVPRMNHAHEPIEEPFRSSTIFMHTLHTHISFTLEFEVLASASNVRTTFERMDQTGFHWNHFSEFISPSCNRTGSRFLRLLLMPRRVLPRFLGLRKQQRERFVLEACELQERSSILEKSFRTLPKNFPATVCSPLFILLQSDRTTNRDPHLQDFRILPKLSQDPPFNPMLSRPWRVSGISFLFTHKGAVLAQNFWVLLSE